MISYNFDNLKQLRKYLLRKIISIFLLILPFILNQIIDIELVNPGYLYLIIGYIAAVIIMDLNHFHIYKIEFDEINHKIWFYAKNLLGKSNNSAHPISGINLYISSRIEKGKRRIYLIEFKNTKKHIATIYSEQLGFNSTDLYHIYKTTEKLGIKNNLE